MRGVRSVMTISYHFQTGHGVFALWGPAVAADGLAAGPRRPRVRVENSASLGRRLHFDKVPYDDAAKMALLRELVGELVKPFTAADIAQREVDDRERAEREGYEADDEDTPSCPEHDQHPGPLVRMTYTGDLPSGLGRIFRCERGEAWHEIGMRLYRPGYEPGEGFEIDPDEPFCPAHDTELQYTGECPPDGTLVYQCPEGETWVRAGTRVYRQYAPSASAGT
jgi:hypothetical protein